MPASDKNDPRSAPNATGVRGHNGQPDHDDRTAPECPTEAAEAATLGAMMLSAEARDGVPRILAPDDFVREAHRVLFEAICRMHRADEPVDAITLGVELNFRNQLDEIGGLVALHELTDPLSTPAPSRWPMYATAVKHAAHRRRLIAKLRAAIDRLEAGDDAVVVEQWIGGDAA